MPMQTKSVLITGASSGIGRETALRLVQAGYEVFAGVRNDKSARALIEDSSDGYKGSLKTLRLDVTKPAQVQSALDEVEREVGKRGLYALVNNAGIAVGGPIETLDQKRLREQFEVNVFGLVHVTQLALPLLRRAKGRIVNMSSVSGRVVMPGLGAYSASKFAVEALSDALRRELKGQGVQVIVVEPGPIRTPIWDKAHAEAESAKEHLSPEQKRLYGKFIENLERSVEEAEANALPVERVAEIVHSAIEAKAPRPRYPVGAQTRVVSWVAQFTPDTWMDRLIAAQVKR